MDLALLDSRLVIALVSTGHGAFLMFLIQMIVNKRGLFTYVVRHNKVGMSTDDAVFGSVRVTWNNSLIRNLYLSIIELNNESQKDYKNVVVRMRSLGDRGALMRKSRGGTRVSMYAAWLCATGRQAHSPSRSFPRRRPARPASHPARVHPEECSRWRSSPRDRRPRRPGGRFFSATRRRSRGSPT